LPNVKRYNGGDPYEAIKVIEAWNLNFLLGNVLKYIARRGRKEGATEAEDLRKAASYLHRERVGLWPWEGNAEYEPLTQECDGCKKETELTCFVTERQGYFQFCNALCMSDYYHWMKEAAEADSMVENCAGCGGTGSFVTQLGTEMVCGCQETVETNSNPPVNDTGSE
jgi:hypothetical protein